MPDELSEIDPGELPAQLQIVPLIRLLVGYLVFARVNKNETQLNH